MGWIDCRRNVRCHYGGVRARGGLFNHGHGYEFHHVDLRGRRHYQVVAVHGYVTVTYGLDTLGCSLSVGCYIWAPFLTHEEKHIVYAVVGRFGERAGHLILVVRSDDLVHYGKTLIGVDEFLKVARALASHALEIRDSHNKGKDTGT